MWPAYCEAFRPYVEPLFGWNPAELRVYFDKSWRKRHVVLVGGHAAGWLELVVENSWLFLNDIGLLQAYRNQGLGTQIIKDVLAYADANDLQVELQVLVTNPAQHLYQRMGFKPSHMKMYRKPVN